MGLSAKELIQPVSAEKPCGENLEYDAAFQKMESLLQATAEQEFGDTVIPAVGPDWKGVGRQAGELLKQTRDLRVLSYVAIANLHTFGLSAFRDALEALNACMEIFWESIYPELDTEDNNDATMRFNVLQVLNDRRLVSVGIERSTLVELKGVGGFSLQDIELAEGKTQATEGEHVQDIAIIQGAFVDANPEDLTGLNNTVNDLIDQLSKTVELWGRLTENATVLDMDTTLRSLKDIQHVLGTYAPVALVDTVVEDGAEAVVTGAPLSSAINNRNDVIRSIDRICEYYTNHEPSSPVPLILRRAQRLVAKSFYEILEDMLPESVAQARIISGKKDP
ncbi:MAG: type VI secretion system protein TssA [Xanthomonadales bacterium]|nr:type VI secretion system protein TssA [Xanthomonadales bacterium]